VGKDVVEGAGGRVATIDYIPERSTSGIIDRILQRFGPRVGTK
jgi:bifunctional ADP-heptose synthase (sugar kinase/adenylyltransferase)